MPFISDYAKLKNHYNENTQKNKKLKLEHCKQQSNNHISFKMAFVVLVFKHKVLPVITLH